MFLSFQDIPTAEDERPSDSVTEVCHENPAADPVGESLEPECNAATLDCSQTSRSTIDLSVTAETATKSASCNDLTNYAKTAGASVANPAASVASDIPRVPSFGEPSPTVANESDVDFVRLGIVPENLVASLFDDDNAVSNAVAVEQKPAEPRKGFVTNEHPDASNWFYQDPQGVIQGEVFVVVYFFSMKSAHVNCYCLIRYHFVECLY